MSTKANLSIDQGTTYSVTLTLTDDNGDPINLAGFTAYSKIKKWYTSSNSVTFNISINTSIGTITLELDANVTSTMRPGRYVYDVDVTDGVSVSRVLEGLAYVTPGVTTIPSDVQQPNYLLAPDGSRIVTPDGDYLILPD